MKKKETTAPVLDEKGRKPLKLDYPQTFKVGFAFAIIMLFWTAYDFVVPLLLEQAFGLPSWARGLIMGLDNLLSLFMLPVFGKLSDNAHGKLAKKFGRRTPFIVIGTLCAVILMVFVPVSTLNQQKTAEKSLETHMATEFDMQTELEKWYDAAVKGEELYGESARNFCDIDYLTQNKKLYESKGMTQREFFTSLRYYDDFKATKAVLNMIGAETYTYKGEEVSLDDICPDTGLSYKEMKESNANYKTFVAPGMGNYESNWIYNNVTKTSGIKSLAIYMVILLLVLIAMATFRSPAVALMPDVTPKPLRSQANAVINLCGGIGGAIAFLIYTIVLFGTRIENYIIIFASVAAGMLLLLAGFLALVKEKKLVAKCQEICREYEIDDFADGETAHAEKFAEELIREGDAGFDLDSKPNGAVTEMLDETVDEQTLEEQALLDEVQAEQANAEQPSAETIEFAKDVVENSQKKFRSPKEWWSSKTDLEKGKLKSFILILASIFMWFMGYNAVSSNLSIYTTKALNLSAGVASIISGVSMGISAIAFIPVGYMAAKIGRRKSIIIGFGLAVISFVLICFTVSANDNALIPSVLFALFYLIAGFGLIIANVNTFPMVTELSTAETVGQYTGYYYVATMSAQAITPTLGGLVMDFVEDKYLFLYSAICIVIAIVLMLFVKHGDSIVIGKGRKLTKEEKKQIRLDALDAD